MRRLILWLLWSLALCTVLGQSAGDTTQVQTLLAEGRRCLLKPGEEKADLDSALYFTGQAAALSRQLTYQKGVQAAALLKGNIYVEAKNWPAAWTVYPTLNDTGRIRLLAIMVRYRLNSEGTTPDDLDSARLLAVRLISLRTAANNPATIGDIYEAAALYYQNSSDKKRAMDYWTAGFCLLRPFKDIDAENAYAEAMQWSCREDTALTPGTLAVLEQLADDEQRLLPSRTSEQQIDNINQIAVMAVRYYNAKQPEAAIRTELIAGRVNQSLHQHCTGSWFTLTYIYALLGRTKEGMAAALETLQVAETPNGPINCNGYEAVTRMYYTTGNYDKYLEYFQMAISYFRKDPGLFNDAGGLFYRGIEILLERHRLREAQQARDLFCQRLGFEKMDEAQKRFCCLNTGNCFQAAGKADSAEHYYREALKYVPRGLSNGKISVYCNLAILYTDNRLYAKARPLLDTLTSEGSRLFSSFVTMATAWQLRYRADSALHRYASAVTDLRHYQSLHDSLINIAKNGQLAQLEVQYETEKKNKDITDLERQNTLQVRLQQSTVRQDRIVRNSLIGGAALLALLAAVLYNRYRVRQRMARNLQKLTARQQDLLEEKEGLLEEKEKLLDEKEWLLRELHHRVKNNLHLVASLLHLQSDGLQDAVAIDAFEGIRARVNAISLAHKKLYLQGSNVAVVDMPDYIQELTGHLQFGLAAGLDIYFQLDIAPLQLDVAQSVPIGLILNEAITNSIKYAFPRDAVEYPQITISLQPEDGNWINLRIADNGVGLPPDLDPATTTTLGLQIIRTLCLQIDGTFEMSGEHGFTILIRFPRLDPTKQSKPVPTMPLA